MSFTDGDYDLSPVLSPMRTSGLDPNDPKSLSLFTKLQGGGVGIPAADATVAPANPDPVSSQPNRAPAAVTPSGTPQGKTIAQKASERAYEQISALPSVGDELDQEKALQEKRTADASTLAQQLRDPETGKLQDQYRPSVGQRVIRGLQGFARGGVSGALNAPYGAPNNAGQQELRREQGAVASDDQSLTEMGRRFKEAREAATSTSKELTAIASEDRANRPTTTKTERVIDPASGEVRYVTPEEANAGHYKDPTTYNAENKQDKAPTNYEQTVIAAENETDPNGPMHRAAQKMRDTEIRKFKAGNSGRQPTETELWAQAFQSEYGRKPNAEEIASRHVSGGGTAGGAAPKSANTPARAQSREAFELHWSKRLGPGSALERKYDAQRKEVTKDTDLTDEQKNAANDRIEAEREAEKQKLQDEKDTEAQQYGVYNQPAATAPTTAAPSHTPSPNAGGKKLDPKNPEDLALARSYLQKAGGDKEKARRLAKADGHTF